MNVRPTANGPIAVIAWSDQTRRADEIAHALGGVSRHFAGFGLHGARTAPIRWLLSALATSWWLARVRPRAVIVQNPPVFLPCLAWLYGTLLRVPVVVDSHPASFGRKGDRVWRWLLPLHHWVVRRVTLVLVTVQELCDQVARWGGRAAIVHEAPPIDNEPSRPRGGPRGRPRFLVACVFAPDEPIDIVVEAARQLPAVDIQVTGDPAKAPDGLAARAPGNVELLGFLGPVAYRRAVAAADAVVVLTTASTSVVRAGFEAVYARRPLIISDWPVLRDAFPSAIHVPNTAEGLVGGFERAIARYTELEELADAALETQQARWLAQLAEIAAAVDAHDIAAAARAGTAP
jgi:Glycosyl transferase 4-like domain